MKKHISAFLLLLAVSVTTIFGCASTKETTSDSTKSEKTSTEMTPVTLNELLIPSFTHQDVCCHRERLFQR